MSGTKLLAVCLLTIGLTAGVPGSRIVDHTRLAIADGPERPQKISPWERNANVRTRGPPPPLLSSVPPYAVKMEPAARYSQQDPLYAAASNGSAGYGSPATGIAARDGYDDGHVSASENSYAPYRPDDYYQHHHDHHKEPEPIIEIIIKESNESLPAPPPPPPTPQRPAREPVQVFYVKYKKNPNSYGGKEDIVYEPPVPAVTPSSAEVTGGESETASAYSSVDASQQPYGYVTGPPPAPSTTYRTIIKPDSEVYHGTGGLRVTFGKTEAGGGWSPSAPGTDAQKRDSVGEASDARVELANKNADREFKRSFAQPAPQLVGGGNNNFETPPNTNRPPPPQQLHVKLAGQQAQNYFHEDSLRPNFQGQIPILNQPFKPQNGFDGISDQRPINFIDHFRNQPAQQQFNRPSNFQQLHNEPSNALQLPHQQIHNPPIHQQFNNQQNHQQFVNQQNNQQFNNPQNHLQQFTNQQFNNQQRQPDFQLNPPLRNPIIFQDRPVQTNSNNDRPLINKPFENRPPPDRLFDNKPFENRPLPERHFENRPFENVPVLNRPFESQPTHTKPFENRPIFDRPFENRPIQNRPVENRPIQDRPFDNRQHQGIVNYRPNKPPNPQNIPLNPNPSFVPNDRRPTNPPPPQLPPNYNTQPISTKHTVDLAFSPLQQQQQHQQFQQQQFQQQQLQQQFGPIENRPPVNNNPTSFQQPSIKLQPSISGVNTFPVSQYQQQLAKPQQFNSEIKPSSTPQLQITPSSGFKLESNRQPAQSGQFIEHYNRYSPTQTEKNSIRTDNIPWQISSQNTFKQQPQEHKEYFSASTTKNTLDTTSKSVLKTTEKPASFVTLQHKERNTPTTTVTPVKATTTELVKNDTKKTDFKNIASLPDEVPDELREQLLSSGILSNADIQILDYDKVGDIPIESLPPEALENLYGQGSAPVPSVVLPPNKSNVQMKVVKYDPATEEGRKIENSYIDRPKSQTLDPVVLNDKGYTRFLPLNINGTHFPIPDSPLLKNKAIGSVVILSPVGYDLSDDQSRPSRNTAVKVKGVHFIVGDIVKNLVKDPNRKNFEIWLEKEKNTRSEEQSVVLLVTKPNDKANGKEIYMYDVTHNQVNKLSGDLSATFVDVAESNSHSHDLDNLSSEEEVDVVVSENSANDEKPAAVVSGYGKTNDFPSSIVATANN